MRPQDPFFTCRSFISAIYTVVLNFCYTTSAVWIRCTKGAFSIYPLFCCQQLILAQENPRLHFNILPKTKEISSMTQFHDRARKFSMQISIWAGERVSCHGYCEAVGKVKSTWGHIFLFSTSFSSISSYFFHFHTYLYLKFFTSGQLQTS